MILRVSEYPLDLLHSKQKSNHAMTSRRQLLSATGIGLLSIPMLTSCRHLQLITIARQMMGNVDLIHAMIDSLIISQESWFARQYKQGIRFARYVLRNIEDISVEGSSRISIFKNATLYDEGIVPARIRRKSAIVVDIEAESRWVSARGHFSFHVSTDLDNRSANFDVV